jgi:hypothetical protein
MDIGEEVIPEYVNFFGAILFQTIFPLRIFSG